MASYQWRVHFFRSSVLFSFSMSFFIFIFSVLYFSFFPFYLPLPFYFLPRKAYRVRVVSILTSFETKRDWTAILKKEMASYAPVRYPFLFLHAFSPFFPLLASLFFSFNYRSCHFKAMNHHRCIYR